jgi:amino acid transporter
MENNTNTKKWNKEVFYSIGAFILVILCGLGLSGLLDKVDYSGITIFRINSVIYNISGGKWIQASWDILYWIPIILSFAFLLLSIWFGIKSIKKTKNGAEKGRMLGIIFTTITSFILILIIIFTIFPLQK